MPPARSRLVVDDARSDISNTIPRERVVSTATTSKGKKALANALNSSLSATKPPVGSGAPSGLVVGISAATDPGQGHPHIDWSTLPMHSLQNYRSAHRLQIPSAYTRPHAELLYNSCDLALRAPSQVLARRKTQELKSYRKRQAQQFQDARTQINGISKVSRGTRVRDKDKKSRTRERVDTPNDGLVTRESIEAPPSPNSHPSQRESLSASAENTSSPSRTASVVAREPVDNTIPQSLNQTNPEATVIGSTSSNTLYTSIRKHFNAQQLNEADTIAKFSYVVRQQGSYISSRTPSLAQRSGPLPPTTAEMISNTAAQAAYVASAAAAATTLPVMSMSMSGITTTAPTIPANAKNAAHAAHSLSAPRTLAGNHIEVEGNYGDGRGWIMGTTSCGRQVRMSDSVGGGGTFRLRFRPTPWGQEVVGSRAPS